MAGGSPVRVVSTLMLAFGALCVGVALGGDLLGFGGAPGIGPRQTLLLGFGLVLAFAGVVAVPERRAWLVRLAEPQLPFADLVVLAAGFGLVTGFVEVGEKLIDKYALGEALRIPDEWVWLVPACYFGFFLVVGLVLGAANVIHSRAVSVPVAVFVFAFLGTWCQLSRPILDPGMVLLIAAGVGTQLARACLASPGRFPALSRRLVPWMVGVVLISMAGVAASRVLTSSAAAASATPARPGPNVILIVSDTVRPENMKLYGYDRESTPCMDALAKEGLVFDWAFTSSSWTLPSHATMFTGAYEHQQSCDWEVSLDRTHTTLAEIFSAQGYATGGFVGNLAYCLAEHGLARGFAHYEDFYLTPGVIAFTTKLGTKMASSLGYRRFHGLVRNDAETVTTQFLNWLPRDGQPFFAFLNYYDAHSLYVAPEPFDTMFGPKSPHIHEWNLDPKPWTDEQMQGFVDAYDGCIAYIDHQIARVVEHLRSDGIADNTLLIITADHGEHFGDHDLMSHGNSLYAQLTRAPMIMSFPGVLPPGRRIADLVTHRDLGKTILDLVGLPDQGFPGHSLAPLWGAEPAAGHTFSPVLCGVSGGINTPAWEPIAKGDMTAAAADGMHLIRNGDGTEELYDLAADPWETNNLIETDRGKTVAARLRAMMQKLLGQ